MTNKIFLAVLATTLAFTTQAQINWSADIAPILYENCAKCHRDGGIGHFSLVGFGNAYT
ncbi:MAG: hypothetical protein JNJ57_09700, partial [Saprospiraceae bacterium]|nr:hypothetical protein [Saprospiraceae bacterium]